MKGEEEEREEDEVEEDALMIGEERIEREEMGCKAEWEVKRESVEVWCACNDIACALK